MLVSCAKVGNVELLHLLLDSKASINKKINGGFTALFVAANQEKFYAVKFLLEQSTLEDIQNTDVRLACISPVVLITSWIA